METDRRLRRIAFAVLFATAALISAPSRADDYPSQDLHFITMNRADLVFAICHLIGLRAENLSQAATWTRGANGEAPVKALSGSAS